MYGTTQYSEIPQAFLSDPAVWDDFIGQVWHGVLAPLALPADGVVIEIAPGSSAKIAHALAARGFCGTLHLVEASHRALTAALVKYRALLPHARIHAHAAALHDALLRLPVNADALLASHVLDDMLLAYAQTDTTFDWAVQYSDNVSTATLAAWHALSKNPATLASAIQQTAAALFDSMTALRPRHAVFSQYPSATLRDNALSDLNTAALAALDGLRTQAKNTHVLHDCAPALATLPHYNNAHIGLHVLNPRYWLSCTQMT